MLNTWQDSRSDIFLGAFKSHLFQMVFWYRRSVQSHDFGTFTLQHIIFDVRHFPIWSGKQNHTQPEIFPVSKFCILVQQVQHTDYTIFTVFYAALVSTLNIYACCYFGEMATQSYVEMSNGLNKCNWYMMNVDLQRYFILMIANAQRPMYYHGFKIFILNSETFLDVRIFPLISPFHRENAQSSLIQFFLDDS